MQTEGDAYFEKIIPASSHVEVHGSAVDGSKAPRPELNEFHQLLTLP
jgi:hypothetical protein